SVEACAAGSGIRSRDAGCDPGDLHPEAVGAGLFRTGTTGFGMADPAAGPHTMGSAGAGVGAGFVEDAFFSWASPQLRGNPSNGLQRSTISSNAFQSHTS